MAAGVAALWTWGFVVATSAPLPSTAPRTGTSDRPSHSGRDADDAAIDRSDATPVAARRSSPRPTIEIEAHTSDADVEGREPEHGRLEGTIAASDGLAMIILLDTETGTQHRTVVGPDGEFALEPLTPGDYEVWATAVTDARLGAIVQPDSVEAITIAKGDTTFVELDGPRGSGPESEPDGVPTSTVRGTLVADDTGAPLAETAILIAPAGEGRWGRGLRTLTDASGRFEIEGVPSGDVRLLVVQASPRDGELGPHTASHDVHVLDGQDTELEPLRVPPREGSAS